MLRLFRVAHILANASGSATPWLCCRWRFSIVVLAGAGLLVRTLLNLQAINPGFDTNNLLLFGINPTMAEYKDQQMMHLYGELQQRFAALPGVVSASYSDEPLLSGGYSADEVHLDGAPPKINVNTDVLTVGPGFFLRCEFRCRPAAPSTPRTFLRPKNQCHCESGRRGSRQGACELRYPSCSIACQIVLGGGRPGAGHHQ